MKYYIQFSQNGVALVRSDFVPVHPKQYEANYTDLYSLSVVDTTIKDEKGNDVPYHTKAENMKFDFTAESELIARNFKKVSG